MAYAALASLAQTVDEILDDERYSISSGEKQQIISINEYVIFCKCFFEDFPDKANNFEVQIRDLANGAEDTIEYLMLEQFRSRRRQLGYHFHKLEKVAKKIESIAAKKIESIAEQVTGIEESFRVKDEQNHYNMPAASSSSVLAKTDKDVMVGFDNDLTEIKSRLCGESTKFQVIPEPVNTDKDVMVGFGDDLTEIKARLCGESTKREVIPIFGMGGIGKTTLARCAFNDQLIIETFHIRAWVTISQYYSEEEIVSRLLESMKMPSEESCEQSKEKVYKRLKGMRYVIVMDDVWSSKVWDDLRMIFPEDHNGSRIMLTTRLSDVAAYPDSYSPLHKMRLMDEEQSWNLLRQKVFTHHDCPSELENIGKEIAESCRGLPLAIVVIAGLLTTVSNTVASWADIAKNVNSAVGTKDGHFEKILSLSYINLPHHLRACFLYMGGFPEDYEIRVSKLVKLWVAEGFLGRSLSEISEKVAEEYLEDLVKRSLILVGKRKSNGKIKSCSVHDLVRDLCIRKAKEGKFLLHAEKNLLGSKENQRRMSVTHFRTDCLANIHNSMIRTIKCFQCRGIAAESLGNYKLLRVLVAIYTSFTKPDWESISFSDQVSELFRLRYLDLYYVNRLPAAISNLQNLQTLIIHTWKTSMDYPHTMVNMPREIWRMPQLRHLISYFFGPLPVPGEETHALENLQTLSVVVNFECNKRILEKIPNLKKLGISYHNSGDIVDFQLENLVYLRHLENLKIKIYADFRFRQYLKPVFPTSLKKLTLSGSRLRWEDMGVVGSLPSLEVLKLRDFALQGPKWETKEGEFHELKLLLIDKSDLQHWITEKSHFPRLKCLVLHRCWGLKGMPDDIGEIPTLELIEVDKVNKSLVESAQQIQEEQEGFGNALQLRLVDDKLFSYFDSFEKKYFEMTK